METINLVNAKTSILNGAIEIRENAGTETVSIRYQPASTFEEYDESSFDVCVDDKLRSFHTEMVKIRTESSHLLHPFAYAKHLKASKVVETVTLKKEDLLRLLDNVKEQYEPTTEPAHCCVYCVHCKVSFRLGSTPAERREWIKTFPHIPDCLIRLKRDLLENIG